MLVMLETSAERVKLLKAGISGRDIEKLYIVFNSFKIVGNPLLFKFAAVDSLEKSILYCDIPAEENRVKYLIDTS